MSVILCLLIQTPVGKVRRVFVRKHDAMADTRITINCEDHGEDCTISKVTAERDYKPIFTEAFYSTEKPLGVHLY